MEARLRGEKEAALTELRHELHGCKVAAEVGRQEHEVARQQHELELAAAHERSERGAADLRAVRAGLERAAAGQVRSVQQDWARDKIEAELKAEIKAAELSGEAESLAAEVRGLRERNSAQAEAKVLEAERVLRLEAGVATALSEFEGEVRRGKAESVALLLLLVAELRGSEHGSEAEAAGLKQRLAHVEKEAEEEAVGLEQRLLKAAKEAAGLEQRLADTEEEAEEEAFGLEQRLAEAAKEAARRCQRQGEAEHGAGAARGAAAALSASLAEAEAEVAAVVEHAEILICAVEVRWQQRAAEGKAQPRGAEAEVEVDAGAGAEAEAEARARMGGVAPHWSAAAVGLAARAAAVRPLVARTFAETCALRAQMAVLVRVLHCPAK